MTFPPLIVRPFNNYGPHQHLEKVVPRFITSALLNEPLTIHGDGSASRDWIYVLDHCRALDAILHADDASLLGKAVNIGTGTDVDIKTLAKMILARLNKSEDLITYVHNRPGQVERHIASTDMAKHCLGWSSQMELAAGLDRTIEWYASNRHWWEPLRWMRQIPIKLKNGTVVMH